MEENKAYQLMCTYFKNKYFVSTIYREASTIEPIWYFETMVWEWDSKTNTRGSIIEQEDSGYDETMAMQNHFIMLQKLNKLIPQTKTNRDGKAKH